MTARTRSGKSSGLQLGVLDPAIVDDGADDDSDEDDRQQGCDGVEAVEISAEVAKAVCAGGAGFRRVAAGVLGEERVRGREGRGERETGSEGSAHGNVEWWR